MSKKETPECCSFCDKSFDTVKILITSNKGIHICNECVGLCCQIVFEKLQYAEVPKEKEEIKGSEIR